MKGYAKAPNFKMIILAREKAKEILKSYTLLQQKRGGKPWIMYFFIWPIQAVVQQHWAGIIV